jgi:hypothetical protein
MCISCASASYSLSESRLRLSHPDAAWKGGREMTESAVDATAASGNHDEAEVSTPNCTYYYYRSFRQTLRRDAYRRAGA